MCRCPAAPGVPSDTVIGREREYLAWIFATKSTRSYAIEPAALDDYTRQYSVPGAMRAGFAWYRANFDAEGLAQAKRGEAITWRTASSPAESMNSPIVRSLPGASSRWCVKI